MKVYVKCLVRLEFAMKTKKSKEIYIHTCLFILLFHRYNKGGGGAFNGVNAV